MTTNAGRIRGSAISRRSNGAVGGPNEAPTCPETVRSFHYTLRQPGHLARLAGAFNSGAARQQNGNRGQPKQSRYAPKNLGISKGGEMAERLNAAVLKTVEGAEPSVGSNPTLSARTNPPEHPLSVWHIAHRHLTPDRQGYRNGQTAIYRPYKLTDGCDLYLYLAHTGLRSRHPDAVGENHKVPVEIVDHRGIESLKVLPIED